MSLLNKVQMFGILLVLSDRRDTTLRLVCVLLQQMQRSSDEMEQVSSKDATQSALNSRSGMETPVVAQSSRLTYNVKDLFFNTKPFQSGAAPLAVTAPCWAEK